MCRYCTGCYASSKHLEKFISSHLILLSHPLTILCVCVLGLTKILCSGGKDSVYLYLTKFWKQTNLVFLGST